MIREDFLKEESEQDEIQLNTANIIVAGITGTGKSTLINAVFGSEMAKTGTGEPITEYMEEHKDENIPIRIWDTVGLELDSEKTQKSIKDIKEKIAEKASSNNKLDIIHAIWYCINSGSHRYQGAELEFIKSLYSIGVPFIIVLTQCSGNEDEINAFQDKIKETNASKGMGDIEIVQVMALPDKLRGDIEIPAFGLDDLVKLTLKRLPDYVQAGFIAAQRVSKQQKRELSEEVIYRYVWKAQLGFWDKVPLINVFITDRHILKMFKEFGGIYNTVLSEELISKVLKESGVDFKNNFFGLISPIDMGYSKKIANMLDKKKNEGFEVKFENLDKNDRAARMIAFYGYIFIESIEEIWENLNEKELRNIDNLIKKLIDAINEKLHEKCKSIGVKN